MKSLTVTVSPAPKNRNTSEGRKWYGGHRERQRIRREVWAQVAALGWPKLRTPVKLTAVRRAPRMMDGGGAYEAVKRVLDALVHYGVIPDDSEKHVPLPWDARQEKARGSWTGWSELVLTLEEME